jgi:hypothetical protein
VSFEAGDDLQVHTLCSTFAETDQQRCSQVPLYTFKDIPYAEKPVILPV